VYTNVNINIIIPIRKIGETAILVIKGIIGTVVGSPNMSSVEK